MFHIELIYKVDLPKSTDMAAHVAFLKKYTFRQFLVSGQRLPRTGLILADARFANIQMIMRKIRSSARGFADLAPRVPCTSVPMQSQRIPGSEWWQRQAMAQSRRCASEEIELEAMQLKTIRLFVFSLWHRHAGL